MCKRDSAKGAATPKGADANGLSDSNNSKIRKGTKLFSVISHLVDGNTLHRFQAEMICHDHVLPSTIAGFQRGFGIPVNREYINVPGYNGSMIRVAKYWMDQESRDEAKKLLEVA
ncbi:MAG: hypothetical protein B6D73_15215 [gamma proteobacterium symbiont of Stewartia floridana]|nr:MAG: hypothetical protein B6D73_15215 [gamma proteobacterium symbiont of Stewartia floridana]